MSNYFLEIIGVDNLKGATSWVGPNGKNANMLEIKSFSHNIEMPLSEIPVSSNQGRIHGRSKHESIEVVRGLDQSSIFFHQYCSGGLVAKGMTIHIYANNAEGSGTQKTEEYFKIEMKNVVVAKVSLSGSGDELPEETISLNYNEVQWTYTTPPSAVATGSPKGNFSAAWNLSLNQPLFTPI